MLGRQIRGQIVYVFQKRVRPACVLLLFVCARVTRNTISTSSFSHACFASLSAVSFPCIPTCDDNQCYVTVFPSAEIKSLQSNIRLLYSNLSLSNDSKATSLSRSMLTSFLRGSGQALFLEAQHDWIKCHSVVIHTLTGWWKHNQSTHESQYHTPPCLLHSLSRHSMHARSGTWEARYEIGVCSVCILTCKIE